VTDRVGVSIAVGVAEAVGDAVWVGLGSKVGERVAVTVGMVMSMVEDGSGWFGLLCPPVGA